MAVVEFDHVARTDQPVEIGGESGLEFRELRLGFVRFEKLIEKIGPRTLGRRLDHVEDARNVVGNAPALRSKPDGTHGGHKENPFAVFPDVEARLLEMRAQPVDGLGREPALFFPGGADAVADLPVADVAADDAAHLQSFPAMDDFFEIGGPKMGFDFLGGLEFDRLGLLRGAENGDAADLLFPFLDDGGVADGFDLAQEFVEIHAAAKARLVKFPQRGLVAVMAGRPEQNTAQPATGHAGVVALGRFGLRGFLHVKLPLHLPVRVALGGRAVGGHGAVLADLVERIGGGVGGDAHPMALGFVQKHAAQSVERIGAMARLDLLGEPGDAARFGQKFDGDRDLYFHRPGGGRTLIGGTFRAAISGAALRTARIPGAGKITARATVVAGAGSGLRAARALARAAGSATARATVGTASTVAAAPVKIAARRFPGVVRIRVLVVRLFEPVG